MPAYGHPDAIPVCVLLHAGGGTRLATGPLALDSRSFVTRPVAPVADRHYHHHAADSAHDAAARYGPVAAKDDDLHDAADARRHQLEPGCRLMPILVRRQPDRNRATVGNDPHEPGPRDARDRAEEGQEEREVAVGYQLESFASTCRIRAVMVDVYDFRRRLEFCNELAES